MARKKRVITRVLLILGIVALAAGGYAYKWYSLNFRVFNTSEVTIIIKRNSTQADVIDLLISEGVIKDTAYFRQFAELKHYNGNNIVPGKYKVEEKWTNNRLINHLRAGNGRLESYVRFGQVRNIKQLSAVITKDILLDSAEVATWLTNKENITKLGFNKNTIICMFIPNTYYVFPDITVNELMERMKLEYDKFWTDERTAKAKATKLSKTEVITLASIVYWETKKEKDMPIVAGVYMNRLRIGMPLQADPTLIYALDDYSIRRVLDKHKQVESPYNTYKYTGLPPGPILIPPIKFIDAVLNYQKHDYLYFVAKEDFSGYSYFSKTLSQHIIYAKRYQNALNRQNTYR